MVADYRQSPIFGRNARMGVMPCRSCRLGRPLCVRRLAGIDRLPALGTTANEDLQGQLLTTAVAYLECMSDLNQPWAIIHCRLIKDCSRPKASGQKYAAGGRNVQPLAAPPSATASEHRRLVR